MSGFLQLRNICHDDPRSTVSRESTPVHGVYSFDLQKRARALCNGAVKDAEVANATEDNHSRLLDGGRDSSSDGDNHEEDYDDHEYEDSTTGRRNRRWEPLDEQRLLAWRKEKKPWKWIFEQFPDRMEGAIRLHCHMLQRSTQKKG